MESYCSALSIQDLISLARRQQKRRGPVFEDLHTIRSELRERRKQFLGSYISLECLVRSGSSLDENAVKELSQYLGTRTPPLLHRELALPESLCCRFYRLAIYAIGGGGVGNESVDDIIQMAECLVRSQDVFISVMKNLLPPDMIGELFDFTESYDVSCFTSNFEDAVMGAVAVFLGALKDPVASVEHNRGEEGEDQW